MNKSFIPSLFRGVRKIRLPLVASGWSYFFIAVFILIDISFSFLQYYHMPLDGDMAAVIVPFEGFKKMLSDPLGIQATFYHEVYQAPNRFFSHRLMMDYFRLVPFWFQHFTDPVKSLYLACAFIKTFVQCLLLYLLAAAITGRRNPLHKEMMLSFFFLTPFFQGYGFYDVMGILDKAVTYVFFYALPFVFVLLLMLPFFRQYFHDDLVRWTSLRIIFSLLLIIVVSFSGPLNTGVILVSSLLLFVCRIKKDVKLPWNKKKDNGNELQNASGNSSLIPLFIMATAVLFSLYSLYVNRYNTENMVAELSPADRYLRMIKGLYVILTMKSAWLFIFLWLIINYLILKKHLNHEKAVKNIKFLRGVILFSVVYLALLPLGGYRSYRPYVIRYDTFLPVTLSLLIAMGSSSLFILNHLTFSLKKWYLAGTIVLLVFFSQTDSAYYRYSDCEREALYTLSKSKNPIVEMEQNCCILSWDKIPTLRASQLNASLLKLLRITSQEILYYQK